MPSWSSEPALPTQLGIPRLVPAQEQPKAGLFSSCQQKSRVQGPGTAGSGQGAGKMLGSGPKHSPLGLPGNTLLHDLQCTAGSWTGLLHPLPITVHPSSAKHHPPVLCPLRMPVTSLQSHQHLSLRGHTEMRCQTSLSFWRAGAKPTSRLEGDRQPSWLHTLPSERADPCPCSCQGLEPLVPQPTAGSGGGGSCTAPLWPPREVQVAPKPNRVPQG